MPPYAGADCAETDGGAAPPNPNECPSNCHGKGTCQRGRCVCDPGYAGHDCSVDMPCKNNCHGRGFCDRGRCFCFPGFEGSACEKATRCPSGCSAHGQCFYGKCFCDPFYAGEDCSETPQCSKGCGTHGVCRGEDLCVCEPGWTGIDCKTKLQCPKDCSGADHGICHATETGVHCICKNGFVGDDCSRSADKCPADCNNHGICVLGDCKCEAGYTGLDCGSRIGGGTIFDVLSKNTQPAAPTQAAGASGNTTAPRFRSLARMSLEAIERAHEEMTPELEKAGTRSHLLAKSKFAEPRFAQVRGVACPNDCSNQGLCSDAGVCFCNPGRSGADCSGVVACPANCNGFGICQYGKCYCDPDHTGTDCSQKTNARRSFPQPWVTAILCCVFFFIGMVVGRKTLAYSLKQHFGAELGASDEVQAR